MLAERADLYDIGVVQQVLPGLEVGVDAYYNKATNLIDDGQSPRGLGSDCSQRLQRRQRLGRGDDRLN